MPKRVARAKKATERDFELMKWIGTNGVASFKQLLTVFWPEAKERTCQERLLQLEKAGWIERHYVDTSRKRGEQVYSLTKRGAQEHFESAERRLLMIGLPARSELKQQLTAQDTRIVLEQKLALQGRQLISWVNERQLRSEAALLKRTPGSKAWGGLADVPDGRIFVCNSAAIARGNEDNRNSTGKADTTSENNAVQQIEIEIDGQYYGQMLKGKIATLVKSNRPTLWVTTLDRAVRIENEIKQAGASNIQILVVDPLV